MHGHMAHTHVCVVPSGVASGIDDNHLRSNNHIKNRRNANAPDPPLKPSPAETQAWKTMFDQLKAGAVAPVHSAFEPLIWFMHVRKRRIPRYCTCCCSLTSILDDEALDGACEGALRFFRLPGTRARCLILGCLCALRVGKGEGSARFFGGVECLISLLSKSVFLVPSGRERFLSGSVRSVFRVDAVLCALDKQTIDGEREVCGHSTSSGLRLEDTSGSK